MGIYKSYARNPLKVPDNPYGPGSGYNDGTYYSKRPALPIPEDPFLDWKTHTFQSEYVDRVALVDAVSGESVTYIELQHRIDCVASGLADVGVKQGDVVMILSQNCILFPVLVFAIVGIGAVITAVNPANVTSEIAKQVKDSKTSFLITVPELVEKVAKLNVPLILMGQPSASLGLTPVAYLSELLKADPSRAPRVRIRQTDTAVLLHSSGTTGLSKAVKLTHGNAIASSAIAVELTDDVSIQRTYIAIVPMYHIYGLAVLIGNQLQKGSKLVILPKFEFNGFLAALKLHKVTHCPIVPPILISLVKSPLVEKYDLSSVQVIAVGAAPCGEEISTACADRFNGVLLRQGFGMTETCATGASTPLVADIKSHYGSVGILSANLQARIVDVESGMYLPPTQQGELWLRGPSIMQGYLNNERATAETLDKDGWLHTGDVGYFDEYGYLFIVDRLKELIKYNGFQVAPAELEAILLSHPLILDAAVAGFPHEQTGQIPVAFIVRQKGSPLTEDHIKAYVAKQVAPHKRVQKVVFTDSIPKSAAGKIFRRQLRLLPSSKL